MDPYLERRWRDVHTALISKSCDELNLVLPNDLVARTEDRVYVESEDEPPRRISPDVRVSEEKPLEVSSDQNGSVAVAEPVLIDASEPVTESFIEILEIDGERVVTGIEFISPANKRAGDQGRKAYLKKRREFLASDANLVEIDLTRSGDWLRLMKPYQVPQAYRTTYRVLIRRAKRRDKAELFPITLRQRLPTIPIPLRGRDRDVPLNLQELVDGVYQSRRYGSTDYTGPCKPPLSAEDAAWLVGLLKKREPHN